MCLTETTLNSKMDRQEVGTDDAEMEDSVESSSSQAPSQEKVDTCLQALEMASSDAEVFAALLLVGYFRLSKKVAVLIFFFFFFFRLRQLSNLFQLLQPAHCFWVGAS